MGFHWYERYSPSFRLRVSPGELDKLSFRDKKRKTVATKSWYRSSSEIFYTNTTKSYTLSRELRCGPRTRKGAPAPAPKVLGIHSADLAQWLWNIGPNQLSLSVWTSCKPPAPCPDSAHPYKKFWDHIRPQQSATKRTKIWAPPLRNDQFRSNSWVQKKI